MASIDIFLENIERIAKYHNLNTYKEIAEYLTITEDVLKRWKNKTRSPSLKKLDEISDRLNCYSYSLLKKDGEIFIGIENIKNNSRDILLSNLEKYFFKFGRFSWKDKAALFYGFISEDALKSYFRIKNYRIPPLKKLDEMAESLGIPVYELIMKGDINEEADR